MYIVKAHFVRFDQISLTDIYDEYGVYVIWNSNAETIPSYIGEGQILKRFVDHLTKPWARRPLNGLIAIIDQGTPLESKWKSHFIEMALLDVADDIGLSPKHNKAPGRETEIRSLMKRHGDGHHGFRIEVSGQNPLKPPERPQMTAKRVITYRWERDGALLEPEHEWR